MGKHGYEQGYEMSAEEGRALLDSEARRYFKMSGEQFAQKWKAGEFDDEDACPEAVRVAMLLPLAR